MLMDGAFAMHLTIGESIRSNARAETSDSRDPAETSGRTAPADAAARADAAPPSSLQRAGGTGVSEPKMSGDPVEALVRIAVVCPVPSSKISSVGTILQKKD